MATTTLRRPTRRCRNALAAAAAAALLIACGGGGDPGAPPTALLPPPTVSVDTALRPAVAQVAGIDGGAARALARVADARGHAADFVAHELLVQTNDSAALDDVLARRGARLVKSIDFARARLAGVPRLHLIHIDAPAADVAALADDLRAIDAGSRGEHRVSSDEALALLAIGAAEGARGRTVSLNWVLYGDALADGATLEAPSSFEAGYLPNAFLWSYMSRGGAQDIGVGDAWRALAAAGRLGNRVKIMVLDAGFQRDHPDFPALRRIRGDDWTTRNPYPCSDGSACPWHGTSVTVAAMGRPDNGFGSAGPAGPIGELLAMQSPSPDLFSYIAYAVELIATLVDEQPRILNISASSNIPAGVAWFSDSILGAFTGALRANGTLVFASAGNRGDDVDSEDCAIFCWEDSMTFPCESAGVICVGGMGIDRTARAANSNFGTKTETASVDLYAPFFVWDAANPDDPENVATFKAGTSYSAPFAAGIAALVLAADPTLSADQVFAILRDSAHVGGVHGSGGNQFRVDAFNAVRRALGGSIPPFVRIDTPIDRFEVDWRAPLVLRAFAFDLDSEAPRLHWRSDRLGELGSGEALTVMLDAVAAPGTHTLSVSAISGGQGANDSVTLIVRNRPPVLAIEQPNPAGSYCAGESVSFRADVDDPNNPPEHPFPAAGVTWRFAGPGVTLAGTGTTFRVTFAAAGSHTLEATATDELGLQDTQRITLSARSAPCDAAPAVSITSPVERGEPDLVLDAEGSDARGSFATVTLRGLASDREDGTLAGVALRWRTSRTDLQAAELGGGNELTVRLYIGCSPPPPPRPPGEDFDEHTVSLTARDSAGNESSLARRIRIRLLC
jgi:subtilisin family serine protease